MRVNEDTKDTKDTTRQLVCQVPAIFNNVLGGNTQESLTDDFSPGILNFYLQDGTVDPGTLYTRTGQTVGPKGLITYTESHLYRIILIPGGVLGTSVDLHTLTYKDACTKFGIQP